VLIPLQQTLTLVASDAATLEVREANGWRPVCAAPCTTQAFVGREYRVSGPRSSTSRSFEFQPTPYPAWIRADMGSSTARAVGFVLTTIGGVVCLAGSVLAISGSQDGPKEAGTAMVLVGGGALAAGIVLVVNSKTRLTIQTGPVARAPSLRLGKGLELSAEGLRF
jgi:hypothetical protein